MTRCYIPPPLSNPLGRAFLVLAFAVAFELIRMVVS
jgi:hypothetical protein